MDAETIYTAFRQMISDAQNKILQEMAEGRCLGQSAEETGLLYTAKYSKMKQLADMKDAFSAQYQKMAGIETPKPPPTTEETPTDGSHPEEVY